MPRDSAEGFGLGYLEKISSPTPATVDDTSPQTQLHHSPTMENEDENALHYLGEIFPVTLNEMPRETGERFGLGYLEPISSPTPATVDDTSSQTQLHHTPTMTNEEEDALHYLGEIFPGTLNEMPRETGERFGLGYLEPVSSSPPEEHAG